jgi:uncharacterized protein (TIGR01777 family)
MNLPNSKPSVLITGGSGLIGRYLTSLLLEEGFSVSHLSRRMTMPGKVQVHPWSPENSYINPDFLRGTDYIIHLAGANIGEKRWTCRRKSEIISSRVDTARLLHDVVRSEKIPLKAFISASAIGYYGSVTSDRIFTETDPPSDDFLGTTCRLWEEAADLFRADGIRTVSIRTGVVLEKSDSALARFLAAAKFGLFPRLGSGKQYLPWIHISDLCRIYLKAIKDNNMDGAYNAVAPDSADNSRFVRCLARVMGRPFISPPVPSVLLRTIMGESSLIALEGSRISPGKIISEGFRFEFPELEAALENALKS